ncbi:MAG: dihydrodipicolinate synthase family protein [SAR324 cluster bacterium]|nr:dihydrodipicolinate synthase family protein [SAR324 cluster bacterium]
MELDRLQGVVPPAVTPLTAGGDLDGDGLAALIEHFISAEVDGLFMLGSSGEAYVLPDEVRRHAVAEAAACLGERVPLYVGIGDNSLERTLRNAEHAAESGASVLVALSPPYLDYSAAEQASYFRTIADRAPLPVLLYNIPQIVKNPIGERLLGELMAHPNIVGIKDSEANAPKSAVMRTLLQEHPDFRWFEGADALAAQSLLMGAHGLVNGGMNVFPGVYVSLYRAARSGDVPAVRREHQRLMRCLRLLRVDQANSSPFGSFVKTTKYALQVMGICSEHLSFPFEPLSAESKRKVEQFLADLAE